MRPSGVELRAQNLTIIIIRCLCDSGAFFLRISDLAMLHEHLLCLDVPLHKQVYKYQLGMSEENLHIQQVITVLVVWLLFPC